MSSYLVRKCGLLKNKASNPKTESRSIVHLTPSGPGNPFALPGPKKGMPPTQRFAIDAMDAQRRRWFLLVCRHLACWLLLSTLVTLATFTNPRAIASRLANSTLIASNRDKQSEDARQEAEDLLKLADKQNEKDHVLASQTAERALQRWQSLAHKSGMARAYGLIGRCNLAQSNLAEATKNYQNALAL